MTSHTRRSQLRLASRQLLSRHVCIGHENYWLAISNRKRNRRRNGSMRCRDAKIWLNDQRDGDLELPTVTIVTDPQKHLSQCDPCRDSARQQSSVEVPLHIPTTPVQASISTDQIMRAVKQQQRITQQ